MIVLVDNEHASGYDKPWGNKVMAARVRIKYELEDMSGHTCLIVRWDKVTPELLKGIDTRAIFVSGNSASADEYGSAEQAGLRDALLCKAWPVFGFCGGHHVIGDVSSVQMIVHDALPIVGTQLHPEYATDEHPAGRILIKNFMKWSNLI